MISIHAPREGSDGVQVLPISDDELFLSTLPARGATGALYDTWDSSRISIHAPREGSDRAQRDTRKALDISIHAPREGSDDAAVRRSPDKADFYPRSPRGERPDIISLPASQRDFYPRSPRGERPAGQLTGG